MEAHLLTGSDVPYTLLSLHRHHNCQALLLTDTASLPDTSPVPGTPAAPSATVMTPAAPSIPLPASAVVQLH